MTKKIVLKLLECKKNDFKKILQALPPSAFFFMFVRDFCEEFLKKLTHANSFQIELKIV